MEYISVTEAAEHLGKTRSWIHTLIQAGRIEGVKRVGGGRGTFVLPRNFKILPPPAIKSLTRIK